MCTSVYKDICSCHNWLLLCGCLGMFVYILACTHGKIIVQVYRLLAVPVCVYDTLLQMVCVLI